MRIVTARDAASLLQPLFAGEDSECVGVLHLGAEQRLIAVTFSPPGEAEETDLPVADILAVALKLGASAIILAHNHPSGDPAPSEADRRATRELAQMAGRLGIRLEDHLILAGGRWESLRALSLL